MRLRFFKFGLNELERCLNANANQFEQSRLPKIFNIALACQTFEASQGSCRNPSCLGLSRNTFYL
jgi:hypothetical protein